MIFNHIPKKTPMNTMTPQSLHLLEFRLWTSMKLRR